MLHELLELELTVTAMMVWRAERFVHAKILGIKRLVVSPWVIRYKLIRGDLVWTLNS